MPIDPNKVIPFSLNIKAFTILFFLLTAINTATSAGKLESYQIQAEIIEAEFSPAAQAEKIAELEKVGDLVRASREKAEQANRSNISQESLKAISSQEALEITILQKIHRKKEESLWEQKLTRHTLLKMAAATEAEKLNKSRASERDLNGLHGSLFDFTAIVAPHQ